LSMPNRRYRIDNHSEEFLGVYTFNDYHLRITRKYDVDSHQIKLSPSLLALEAELLIVVVVNLVVEP
jgi:hypothetical protein